MQSNLSPVLMAVVAQSFVLAHFDMTADFSRHYKTVLPLLRLYTFLRKTAAWDSSKTIAALTLTLLAHTKQTLSFVWFISGSRILTLHTFQIYKSASLYAADMGIVKF